MRGAGTLRIIRCEDLGRPDANVIDGIPLSHIQPLAIDLPSEVSRGTSAESKPIHIE